ncbi:hypothetical protein QBC47DRAFT_440102 [Echria macrotheca]|uniref:Uncharacterized protein n=1 Tax=Echria macrotheca TaxID=438768 RepID=A0AAJ0B0U7_9PEZI|nr:hypothetical protein QBC47DRAFT_440102 [Echria macrotheca]
MACNPRMADLGSEGVQHDDKTICGVLVAEIMERHHQAIITGKVSRLHICDDHKAKMYVGMAQVNAQLPDPRNRDSADIVEYMRLLCGIHEGFDYIGGAVLTRSVLKTKFTDAVQNLFKIALRHGLVQEKDGNFVWTDEAVVLGEEGFGCWIRELRERPRNGEIGNSAGTPALDAGSKSSSPIANRAEKDLNAAMSALRGAGTPLAPLLQSPAATGRRRYQINTRGEALGARSPTKQPKQRGKNSSSPPTTPSTKAWSPPTAGVSGDLPFRSAAALALPSARILTPRKSIPGSDMLEPEFPATPSPDASTSIHLDVADQAGAHVLTEGSRTLLMDADEIEATMSDLRGTHMVMMEGMMEFFENMVKYDEEQRRKIDKLEELLNQVKLDGAAGKKVAVTRSAFSEDLISLVKD